MELLEAICRPTIEMSLAAIAQAAAGNGTATHRLHAGVIAFTKVVLQRQANIAVYFREEKHLSKAGLEEINALRKRFDKVLSQLLQEGSDSGQFIVPDVSVAALAIGGMVSWAYTWHRDNGRLTVNEVGEKMAGLALRMVGVRGVAD